MKRIASWMTMIGTAAAVALSVGFNRPSHEPPPLALTSAPTGEESAPSDDRFIILADWDSEAVFDRKTSLVWERSAKTFGSWAAARKRCEILTLGKRAGWRLPTIFELATLVDPNVPSPGPTLPAGHLFAISSAFYWSATTDLTNKANAWGVGFNIGDVGSGVKNAINYVWCVRDGDGLQMTPL